MDDELDDELSIGVFIASYHFLYITDFFIVAVAPNPGTLNIKSFSRRCAPVLLVVN